jgi:hypothetical protein
MTPPAVPTSTDPLDAILGQVVFPLDLRFRVLTLAPRFDIVDATGRSVLHGRQKLFKLREHVELFTDDTRSTRVAEIRADRIIDWSARYSFIDAAGGQIGAVGRKGWKSIWRAQYESFNPGDTSPGFNVREENPFVKLVDTIVGEIPVVGWLTNWFFHPSYLATDPSGAPVMRMVKRPSFWERRFRIEQLGPMSSRETLNLILSFFMLTLLERNRG